MIGHKNVDQRVNWNLVETLETTVIETNKTIDDNRKL